MSIHNLIAIESFNVKQTVFTPNYNFNRIVFLSSIIFVLHFKFVVVVVIFFAIILFRKISNEMVSAPSNLLQRYRINISICINVTASNLCDAKMKKRQKSAHLYEKCQHRVTTIF